MAIVSIAVRPQTVMAKKLCDLKKLLKSDMKAFANHVVDATHLCKKCGRVANCKKVLCEPSRLKR